MERGETLKAAENAIRISVGIVSHLSISLMRFLRRRIVISDSFEIHSRNNCETRCSENLHV